MQPAADFAVCTIKGGRVLIAARGRSPRLQNATRWPPHGVAVRSLAFRLTWVAPCRSARDCGNRVPPPSTAVRTCIPRMFYRLSKVVPPLRIGPAKSSELPPCRIPFDTPSGTSALAASIDSELRGAANPVRDGCCEHGRFTSRVTVHLHMFFRCGRTHFWLDCARRADQGTIRLCKQDGKRRVLRSKAP